jgi:hypothetical protein
MVKVMFVSKIALIYPLLTQQPTYVQVVAKMGTLPINQL